MMAQNSRVPGTGQESFPEITMPVAITPEKRRAFGSIPNLLGRNLDIYFRTDMGYDRVNPQSLMGSLYGEGEHTVSGIALTQCSTSAILRSPTSFARAIGAKTLASRGQHTEGTEAAFLHSKNNALTSKQEQQSKVIRGLEKEIQDLSALMKLIKVPGYAHATEAELRILATSAWEISFNNIIAVAARQRGWGAAEKEQALNAMAAKLTQGGQRARVGYWHDITKVAGNYAVQRRALFVSRQNQADTDIQQIKKNLEALYSAAQQQDA